MLYQNLCPTCGAELQKVEETKYACESCGNVYSVEKIEKYAEKLKGLFDEAKLELISRAKQNLYSAVKEEYISKNEVTKWCDEVKKYIPDDFQANFYYALSNESKREVARMIREIDVNENFACLEVLIKVVIKSLEKSYVAPTKDLVERLYYKADKQKYNDYISAIEKEAENLDEYVYDVTIQRDVFVAYSSKDREKVLEVVEYLENEGFTCFISMRNLRHGVGSQEKYEKFLNKAMDNCTSFLFISSANSRDRECDAWKIEIPYIMAGDKANAPGNVRNFYLKIPYEYKKPRVEYRIQESENRTLADNMVDNFFNGYERCNTLKDVAIRIMQQTMGIDDVSIFIDNGNSNIDANAAKNVDVIIENQIKYCVSCLAENSVDAEQCNNCEGTEFADTKKEAELIKRLSALENHITSTPNAVVENGNVGKSASDKAIAIVQTSVSKSSPIYEKYGSKIKFGSYPQTKVTDESLIEELNRAAGTLPTSTNSYAWTSYHYCIDGTINDLMWYIDVEKGRDKYRGVYFVSARNGSQASNGYHTNTVYWFIYEPISWSILSKNYSDNTAFILCDKLIDLQQFNDVVKNNYAESTIREWLNEVFYNTAFTEQQKQSILTTSVDNSAATTDDSSNQYACQDTSDKIFLLSYQEVLNSNYGFNESYNSKDTARRKKTTDYAQSQGAYTNTSADYAGNGWWWLRSPASSYSDKACYVYCDGDVSYHNGVNCHGGVAPALRIRL